MSFDMGFGPRPGAPAYAELCVTSNFTFLTGASHPEELVSRAAELGLAAIAITDRNSLAGVVRAFVALKELARQREEAAAKEAARLPIRSQQRTDPSSRLGFGPRAGAEVALAGETPLPQLIVGSRLVLADSPVEWLALPTDRPAYARLSRLLSLGKRRAEKGKCHLTRADLMDRAQGMILIALPPDPLAGEAALDDLRAVAARYPGDAFLGAAARHDGQDRRRLDALAGLAEAAGLPLVAVGDVLMHHARRRRLADVLTCLREGLTIDRIGRHALPNGERRLKSPAEMARLFRRHPAAVRRTAEIAARCRFGLEELSYQYPHEVTDGEPAQARLLRLVEAGFRDPGRYPDGPTPEYRAQVARELALIESKGYAPYFLTVFDIMAFARSQGILCQGRGSAANSVVCYTLGITNVHPKQIAMVFERFISAERGEPPDIDVDFEHERREEVIQWIYRKYGRHRAGLTATVIHFRSRAAIREVGKVMGLSQDVLAALSGQIWGWSSKPPEEARLREIGLDPADRRLAQTVALIGEIIGFPRHLSQHVGGFVITEERLDELCPIENAAMEDRTVIEWDKDDIDAIGILKVDVLGLGMLTCLRMGLDLMREHGGPDYTLPTIPRGDKSVYDMLCKADAIGVFQVESRAQMNFLPRMKPENFYDLVIEVAIVRPGPIQGGMVQPYLNRRQGKEKVSYPSPALEGVLGRTCGVPLFQEQAMQIAVVGAGFSPGEADRLRRSLATFRRMGTIGTFRERFVEGMLGNGYDLGFANACFDQIEGFGEYGFPESHAASFAILVYASAWMKRHHPAVFACALLNAQPMGFYAPAQIVRDAREHGVEVRPVCVNRSAWENTLERGGGGALALRLGFRQVKGMKKEDGERIAGERGNGYTEVEDLWRRAGLRPDVLERLAEADAFTALGLSRRRALWQVRAIRGQQPLPLFSDPLEGEGIREPDPNLPAMSEGEEVVEDYLALRLSLRAHPMALLRPSLPGLTPNSALATVPPKRVTVCGLVITRQRPGTASGVIFLTLEDETGVANVVVWPRAYERFRRAVIAGRLLRVTGRLEREGQVVHLIAARIEDVSDRLSLLSAAGEEAARARGPADQAGRAPRAPRRAHHPRDQAKVLFPSRDFH